MSGDNFDKEIADLYQQRKDQLIVPKLDVQQEVIKNSYSPFKLLSIFLVGGMASFGIMAIISHLSSPLKKINEMNRSAYSTDLIIISPKVTDKTPIVPLTPLPPKPEYKAPIVNPNIAPEKHPTNTNLNPDFQVIGPVTVVSLPQITEPIMAIAPTYKVLPKFSHHPTKSNQVGEVKLSYHIDINGNVNNIKIVSSNVNRDLQRSAKKALSQWRYKPNEKIKNEQLVQFIFTPAKE